MEKKITVIGIGRLGLCTALCFESRGYDVTGVDLNNDYVNSLNEKTFRTTEPFVNSYLKQSKHFKATTNLKEGLDHSDLIFIIVPTPTLKNSKNYDHSIIEDLLKKIDDFQVSNKHLIIVSTVMPGFITKIARPLIRNCFNTFLAYNPEFIAQGTIIHDFLNASLVLIGKEIDETGQVLFKLYEEVATNARICLMSVESAEIAKLALNCFVTTKIAFANFIGDLADKTENANKDQILFAIGNDQRIGNKCLKAGFGYGGPCFPRDNNALEYYAESKGVIPFIPIATDESNNFHANFQFEELLKQNDPIVFENVGYKDVCPVPIIEKSQKLVIANKLVNESRKVILIDYDVILKEVEKEYKDRFTLVSKDRICHKIFIIHYSKLKDRYDFMSQQLLENKLNDIASIQWLDFFDRENITQKQIEENFKYNPSICSRCLSMAEIANYLAHTHAIEQIANDPTILYGMIIEDDMIFKKDYVKNLEYACKILPGDWDFLCIGGCYYGGIDCLKKDEYSETKPIIYKPSDYQTFTGNYIIRKETAQRLLKVMKPFSLPIDSNLHELSRKLNLNVYWCRPILSVEGSKTGKYESAITSERGF